MLRKLIRPILPAAIVLAGVATAHAQVAGQAPPADAAPTARVEAQAKATASGPKVYLSDYGNRLGTVDLTTGAVKVIGNLGTFMTDLAFCPGNKLYAISFTKLYKVNLTTGRATAIGSHGVNGLNALTCDSAGKLLAYSYASSRLYTLNPTTGRGTAFGSSSGYMSDGDLVFHEGHLYLSSTSRRLIQLNQANNTVQRTAYDGITNLYGLISLGTDKLWGFSGTRAFTLNDATGAPTLRFNFQGKGLTAISGAAYNGNFQR